MSFGSLDYEFVDLPISVEIQRGRIADAFTVDGVATIGFSREADWWIDTDSVAIDVAYKDAEDKWRTALIDCRKAFPQLAGKIILALHNARADEIQKAVNREFEGAGFIQHADNSNGDAFWARPRRIAWPANFKS